MVIGSLATAAVLAKIALVSQVGTALSRGLLPNTFVLSF